MSSKLRDVVSQTEPLCGSLMFIQQTFPICYDLFMEFYTIIPLLVLIRFQLNGFLQRIFFEKFKGAREFVLNLPDTVSSIKRTIIDPQAADLVSRLLDWNPKKRPTTMEALQR